MPQLDLYYMEVCPYCQKVLKFINDNNISDKISLKEIKLNEEDRENLIKIGGKEQVPCLFIDDKPMYESDDIVNYLKTNIVK